MGESPEVKQACIEIANKAKELHREKYEKYGNLRKVKVSSEAIDKKNKSEIINSDNTKNHNINKVNEIKANETDINVIYNNNKKVNFIYIRGVPYRFESQPNR